jgi:hypothetical protein
MDGLNNSHFIAATVYHTDQIFMKSKFIWQHYIQNKQNAENLSLNH